MGLMDIVIHSILHALKDSLKILPFLFLAYLLMEYIEHRAANKTAAIVKKAGPFGPIAGAVAGLVPQCGFSAAATGLYAGRIVSLGTLIAVYLSTSDEMLPLMISSQVPGKTILSILGVKLVVGMVAGLIIDFVCRKLHKGEVAEPHIHEMCESEHCHCENGIFKSALIHTLKVVVFVILVSFALNCFMEYIGKAGIQYVTIGESLGVVVLASVVGLVPNCATSIALTELYVGGMLGDGALMAGLLVGAGVGILTLFRANKKFFENVKIVALLWVIGLLVGCLINLLGIEFM